MQKTHEWHNVVVAVTAKNRVRALIGSNPELDRYMDGDLFENNSTPARLDSFPQEPGIYVGTLEFWFSKGNSDSYPADSWDFAFVNWREVDSDVIFAE